MSHNLDRLLVALAYSYLALPIIVFAYGWLQWYFALGLSAALVAATVISIRDFGQFQPVSTKQKQLLLWTAIAVFIWVWLSGIGGFAFQNSDHDIRNAIFRDLISFNWPVIYSFGGNLAAQTTEQGALVYYFADWLPAALIGKLLGWTVANVAFYLWTVLGVILSIYFFQRRIGQPFFWLPLLFIFWSGLDIVGYIARTHELPSLGTHLQWWSGLYQYSANTTTLFWVFNQTVTTWLVVMLLFNQDHPRNTIYTYLLSFPYAPLPFIGLAPFVVYLFFKNSFPVDNRLFTAQTSRNIWQNLKNGFTLQNVIAAPFIFLVFALFFTANKYNVSARGWIWSYISPADWPVAFAYYLLFCYLQFGAYMLRIWRSFCQDPCFILTLLLLLFIPNYCTAIGNDFAMRVSIPPLLVLMLYVAHYLADNLSTGQRKKTYVLIALLCIGAINPFFEIYRSVHQTLADPQHIVYDPYHSLQAFDSSASLRFFVAFNPKESFFFTILSKER
jgi:hypothetical protein